MPEFGARPDRHPSNRRHRRYSIIAIVAIVVLAAWGIFSRVQARSELRKQTADAAIITVATIKVSPAHRTEELVLPGNVEAYVDAPIFARTSGYLKRWLVDIGGPVKAGDLLAEIDTPEVDQQLLQVQADLATAEANYRLAQSTAKRLQDLLATDSGAVSKQDFDDKLGDAKAKKTQLASARANLGRLQQMESFKRVVAPFDGVVTARNVDVGALISAGGGGGGPELFHVADARKLRVYVQVPQAYAAAATPGIEAELHFTEHPGRTYPGKLVRTANAIDVIQRTLRVELAVDNSKGELLPGGYTEAHLKLPAPVDTVRVAANALIFRADGLKVATLGQSGKVALKSIKMGRDFGADVEVLEGVTADDNIIVNPPDSLADGQEVRVAAAPPQGASADGRKNPAQNSNGNAVSANPEDRSR